VEVLVEVPAEAPYGEFEEVPCEETCNEAKA